MDGYPDHPSKASNWSLSILYQFALCPTEPAKCQCTVHFLMHWFQGNNSYSYCFHKGVGARRKKKMTAGKQTRDCRHSSLCSRYWSLITSEQHQWPWTLRITQDYRMYNGRAITLLNYYLVLDILHKSLIDMFYEEGKAASHWCLTQKHIRLPPKSSTYLIAQYFNLSHSVWESAWRPRLIF